MSWDFGMEVDVGGTSRVELTNHENYTYNVSPMYSAALLGTGLGGISDIRGRRARDVYGALLRAYDVMAGDPARFEAMNPKNGWGSYEGALLVLRNLIQWAEAAPDAYFTVC